MEGRIKIERMKAQKGLLERQKKNQDTETEPYTSHEPTLTPPNTLKGTFNFFLVNQNQ
ncbi:bifunctional ADP-dependent NA [Sesbania bispinosa]|nr:bifunctional ADP-dependent NA [Sesbania bispinosa]